MARQVAGMAFRIRGLSPSLFQHLYGLRDRELEALGARRMIVNAHPGFPDRIELRDLQVGESALLVNFTHLAVDGPYRSSHAVFVREGAERPSELIDEVPPVIRRRKISLRSFDEHGMMIDARLIDGINVAREAQALLGPSEVAYVHAHYALRGCFAARIDRA